MDRKTIDIMVPVYKSVRLTTRRCNALAGDINEIASSDPCSIVITIRCATDNEYVTGASFIALAGATLRSGTDWTRCKFEPSLAKCIAFQDVNIRKSHESPENT
jgi:hypothetical protein